MKIPSKVHCLFERSGTFKKCFNDIGIPAYDYDISNEFNCTDYIIDIFTEIHKAYQFEKSIFDDISSDDLALAFFPCTRFENQSIMLYQCTQNGINSWSTLSKLYYVMNLHSELSEYYQLFCELCVVALRKDLHLVIENPYSKEHYLYRYFPIKPSIIDYNRSLHGDQFRKPTQYFFINCHPYDNLYELKSHVRERLIDITRIPSVERSFISEEYAKWFILTYLLPGGYRDHIKSNT